MMTKLDMLKSFGVKVAEYCVDITIDKIKEADKNRKVNGQSRETRIYQVVIDALNEFPYNEYKKKEQVYDASESILKQFKSGREDYKENVRAGLRMIVLQVTDNICEEFLKALCDEMCKEENRDLAIGYIIRQGEQVIYQQKQMNRYVQEEFEESHQNEKEILEEVSGVKYLIKKMNGEKGCKTENKSPIVNRADEYAKKWNEYVFLNNFNEEDENAGVNIKLSQIYIEECLPHYIWGSNTQSSDKLRKYLMKYINNNSEKKMLLILGQPGIGKSTLITWIMANLVEKKENILVYQFASDLGNVNWQSNNILDEIFATIDFGYNELEGKALILDGFDEIYVKGDRERILRKINQELEKKNYLKKFSLIVTCRENYVNKVELEGIEYITLQAWDKEQIRRFCRKYEEENIKKSIETGVNKISENRIKEIIEKKDIMGIPLILYMVLALNVDIERSSSTVDIYDQIFSLKKGGIYDRAYDVEHRINEPETKGHIHHISQRIAFWMFENNADEETISQEKFEEICENEMIESEKDEDKQRDVLIGNFFTLKHCEGKGTNELHFVHRSIYEYFVVIYFFESLHNLTSKEEAAGKLGELLKRGRLSKQILEFIKYKFDSLEKYNLSDIAKKVFNEMLRYGMIYYTKVEDPYNNVIERERTIFLNMLEVVSLWNSVLGKFDKKIIIYLQCNREKRLNLRGIQLGVKNIDRERVDLRRVYLAEADLRGAYFRRVDLSAAFLIGADLSGANLSGVYLNEADLRRTNLVEADLSKANLNGANLNVANLSKANLSGANLGEAHLIEAELFETNLSGADLSEAYLYGVDLSGADLSGADLSGADLRRTNLRGVNLIGADLRRTDLIGADLIETIFSERQLNILHEKYDLSRSKVLLSETNEIISYQEYCSRKQKD